MAPIVKDKKLVIGVILIIIGILLFFRNTDIFFFHFPHWLFSWPTILFGIGVLAFLTSDNPTAGLILMAIGGFFLLNRVFAPVAHLFYDFWPLLLVLTGVFILLRHRKKGRITPSKPNDETRDEDGDYIDELAVFGGGNKMITSPNFKGGKITAIFGGGDLDFSQAKLAEGALELEVFAMFGGWDIIVPPNWNIEIHVTPLFGGFSDKRRLYASDITDNSRKLIIRGAVVLGGGELKSSSAK